MRNNFEWSVDLHGILKLILHFVDESILRLHRYKLLAVLNSEDIKIELVACVELWTLATIKYFDNI